MAPFRFVFDTASKRCQHTQTQHHIAALLLRIAPHCSTVLHIAFAEYNRVCRATAQAWTCMHRRVWGRIRVLQHHCMASGLMLHARRVLLADIRGIAAFQS